MLVVGIGKAEEPSATAGGTANWRHHSGNLCNQVIYLYRSLAHDQRTPQMLAQPCSLLLSSQQLRNGNSIDTFQPISG